MATKEAANQRTFVDIQGLSRPDHSLFGRDIVLEQLERAWKSKTTKVVVILGSGGSGKSESIKAWLHQGRRKYHGAEFVYGRSLNSQGGSEDRVISIDPILENALRCMQFGFRDTDSSLEKARALGLQLSIMKSLVVFDGLDALCVKAGDERGQLNNSLFAGLINDIADNINGLCVLTVRPPFSALPKTHERVETIDLESEEFRLSPSDAVEILRDRKVKGPEKELLKAAKEVHFHPLTLVLLGSYISDSKLGRIQEREHLELLRGTTRPENQARQIVAAYEKLFGLSPENNLLRITGLFDCPISSECLKVLTESPPIDGISDQLCGIQPDDLNRTISRLIEARLLIPVSDLPNAHFDAHPIIREHFRRTLASRCRSAFMAAHQRLYQHFSDKAPTLPDEAHDLRLLYRAIWHGCRAGICDQVIRDVFLPRIRRGGEQYSIYVKCLFQDERPALASFFDPPFTALRKDISTAENQHRVIFSTAYLLRRVGRLRESLELYHRALKIALGRSNLIEATLDAGGIATLHAGLGEMADAKKYGEKAVQFAETLKNDDMRCRAYHNMGFVLHCIGDLDGAFVEYLKSERLVKTTQDGGSDITYGQGANRFCNLIIDKGDIEEAKRRTLITLPWMEDLPWRPGHSYPLDAATDRLTLSRVSLAEGTNRPEALAEGIEMACKCISGLENMTGMEWLPEAHLRRSQLYSALHQPEEAREDLERSLSLARHCGLRLIECEAWLETSRWLMKFPSTGSLVVDGKNITVSFALDRARKIVDDTGYWKGKRELDSVTKEFAKEEQKRKKRRTELEGKRGFLTKAEDIIDANDLFPTITIGSRDDGDKSSTGIFIKYSGAPKAVSIGRIELPNLIVGIVVKAIEIQKISPVSGKITQAIVQVWQPKAKNTGTFKKTATRLDELLSRESLISEIQFRRGDNVYYLNAVKRVVVNINSSTWKAMPAGTLHLKKKFGKCLSKRGIALQSDITVLL